MRSYISNVLAESFKRRFRGQGRQFLLRVASIVGGAIVLFLVVLVGRLGLLVQACLYLATAVLAAFAIGLVIGKIRPSNEVWATCLILVRNLARDLLGTGRMRPEDLVLIEIQGCRGGAEFLRGELDKEIDYIKRAGQAKRPGRSSAVIFRSIWDTLSKSSCLIRGALAFSSCAPDDPKFGGLGESEKAFVTAINRANELFWEELGEIQEAKETIDEIYERVSHLTAKFVQTLIDAVEEEASISSEEVVGTVQECTRRIEDALEAKDGKSLCEATRHVLGIMTILHRFFADALTSEMADRSVDCFRRALRYVSGELKRGNDPDGYYGLYRRNIRDRLKEVKRLRRSLWVCLR